MKKTRLTEDQIVKILKRIDAGEKSETFAVKLVALNQQSINGSLSTLDSNSRILRSLKLWKKRMRD